MKKRERGRERARKNWRESWKPRNRNGKTRKGETKSENFFSVGKLIYEESS